MGPAILAVLEQYVLGLIAASVQQALPELVANLPGVVEPLAKSILQRPDVQAWIATTEKQGLSWLIKEAQTGFTSLKAAIEKALAETKSPPPSTVTTAEGTIPFVHLTALEYLQIGKLKGAGKLDPLLLQAVSGL